VRYNDHGGTTVATNHIPMANDNPYASDDSDASLQFNDDWVAA
jgi:hypothetical protein